MLYQALIRIRLDEPDEAAARSSAEAFCQHIDYESCTEVASLVAITIEPEVVDKPWSGEQEYP